MKSENDNARIEITSREIGALYAALDADPSLKFYASDLLKIIRKNMAWQEKNRA